MGDHPGKNIVSIRPLREADAATVFAWRNSPKIVYLSSLQKTVSWQEHLKWIKNATKNKNRLVFIIEYDQDAVGQIRFERTDEQALNATISIYLEDKFTGKGIGQNALQLAIYQVFEQWNELESIQAWVRKENEVSQRFFEKRGFIRHQIPEDTVHVLYVFSKNKDKQKNIDFYTSLLTQHGIDVRSLNWGSKKSQELRFRVLVAAAPIEGKTFLDIGCGLGDFYAWMEANEKYLSYTGIDITPAMIERARSRFPEIDFKVVDILIENVPNFDIVAMSGVFTYQSEAFMQQMIRVAFAKANTVLAFNALSSWADQQEEGEFYADPLQTFAFCKTITPWVTLRHDYHPGDFTIYMYKNAFS